MREKYESLPLVELKALAKARGLKGISTMRKPELIERMLEEDKKEAAEKEAAKPEEVKKEAAAKEKAPKKEKTPAEPVVLKCPKCGNGEVIKGRTAWGCSLYRKSCDFIIPMEFFGKKLTQKQVEALVLKGKTGSLNGFKNEDGSTFSGTLRLDDSFRVVVDKK